MHFIVISGNNYLYFGVCLLTMSFNQNHCLICQKIKSKNEDLSVLREAGKMQPLSSAKNLKKNNRTVRYKAKLISRNPGDI